MNRMSVFQEFCFTETRCPKLINIRFAFRSLQVIYQLRFVFLRQPLCGLGLAYQVFRNQQIGEEFADMNSFS